MKLIIALLLTTGFMATAQAEAVHMSASLQIEAPANECTDITVITRKAAIHSSSYKFRCSNSDEYEVINSAEASAEAACYKEGFTECRLKISRITETGYLGYQKGFDKTLGYGCLAEAVMHAKY